MSKSIPELQIDEIQEGEVGEPVEIETPASTIRAIWLGPVGTGPGAMSLTEAMQLMNAIAAERQAQSAE